MSRKFIATVLAASIAITGFSSAPARASDDNLAKFLFGAAALAIIGTAISNQDNDGSYTDNNRVDRRDGRQDHDRVVRPRPVDRGDRDHSDRHRPRRVKALPSSCLRVFKNWDGRVRMMGKRCLERRYDYVSSLPRACRVKVQTDVGKRRGYQVRCLKKRGYFLARG